MTAITLTTELEAVNTMLSCIGESPINSLEVTGVEDADAAKAVLNEVSRQVQSIGWHFNSETDYSLVRDVDGFINVPSNTITVDTTDEFYNYDVVQRGLRLYNKKDHTFVFDKTLKVDIVLLLPWDELPQAARRYIEISAARVFQVRRLGSDTLHKFSEMDELKALSVLKDNEGETGDYNVLSGSYSVANILQR